MASPAANAIVPAQLGFLAIFNPSLGYTDETIEDQIVYYASVTTQSSPLKRRRARGRPTDDISQEERNERLRQIGLAQGMASFGRGFADGASVDTIDTEQSRLVLHELEPGWWILASIDLTKIPLPPRLPSKNNGEKPEERYEHSAKEIKPANLLLRDLLRAHSTFLMHHGSSLSALFVRSKRKKFITVLGRYWDLFLSTWSVMLHGNPIRSVFAGINVAASGELGVGVGEEDRGSGEREVLEGLVGRIEGLVDLVVSKFGDGEPDAGSDGKDVDSWLGTGQEPGPEDGAIFLGTGALSRKSLRDVTHWMEDLYTWGEHAYGVIDSPTSIRRPKTRHASKSIAQVQKAGGAAEASATTSETGPRGADGLEQKQQPSINTEEQDKDRQEGGFEKMVGYLKLGYGTYWSLPGGSNEAADVTSKAQGTLPLAKEENRGKPRPGLPRRTSSQDDAGHFLIGLKGDIEETQSESDLSHDSEEANADNNSRTVLRTIHIELESEANGRPEATIVRDFEHPASILTQSQVVGNMLPGYDSHDLNKSMKLRVVVYVNRPFIFTFLFALRTDSLAWDTLYRSLHHQLAPLKRPLLTSTRYRPERPNVGPVASSIHELIWDPQSLTMHCTIPNIPEQYTPADSWSRADALSTHLQLLHIHSSTRSAKVTDLERTQKTSRGWWIVWTRLLQRREQQRRGEAAASNLNTIHESEDGTDDSEANADDGGDNEDEENVVSKEIFLLRCASDHARFRGVSGSYIEAGTGTEGAGKLAQGIGVDTRRYVEELLSLL